MASRHTEHYGLSQWEASDKVERTDFNADNAAVDGALHALAQSKAETAALSQLSGLVAQKADQTALEALEGRLDGKADQEGLSGVERRLSAVEGSMPRTAFGSYTGNGTSGPESPVSLAYYIPPHLFVVRRSRTSPHPSRQHHHPGLTQGAGQGHNHINVNVTWSGNQVSWYTSKDNPSTQMNSEGVEYFYFAIG